jgi:hypothetical protein
MTLQDDFELAQRGYGVSIDREDLVIAIKPGTIERRPRRYGLRQLCRRARKPEPHITQPGSTPVPAAKYQSGSLQERWIIDNIASFDESIEKLIGKRLVT